MSNSRTHSASALPHPPAHRTAAGLRFHHARYDNLGRTLSVSQPGNSGTTTYVYEGNSVTVTDPAGKWKKYTTDVLGNLAAQQERMDRKYDRGGAQRDG